MRSAHKLDFRGYRFNRDPHFQRVMAARLRQGPKGYDGFNRDPHFQRVMVGAFASA